MTTLLECDILKKMTIEQIADFLRNSDEFLGNIKMNENLSSHTTIHVGGLAKIFIEPEDSKSLVFAVRKLKKEKIDFFVLAGGSNVIISDKGLETVISTRKINKIFSEDLHKLKIDAGTSWGSVISFCKKNNLGGFESFKGLSGTVGGAVFMNATCFGLSACDNLLLVEYFDLQDEKIHIYEKNDCDWGYKKSPFQNLETTDYTDAATRGRCGELPAEGGGGATAEATLPKCDAGGRLSPSKIILSATFCVTGEFELAKSEKCMEARKEKGHFRALSAGSAFKNDGEKGIVAGKIIDECGLKGFCVGGAQIAPWHGNFIINPEQKATAQDIKMLSDEVKKIVRKKTGVSLESEIIFVG